MSEHRCPARHRNMQCSLWKEHEGEHRAYFADQPRPRRKEPIPDFSLVYPDAPDPVPERKNVRSHHLKHPGGWIPQTWIEIPEEDPEEEEIRRELEVAIWG